MLNGQENDQVHENEQKKLKQLEKSSNPLWLTKKFVEKPCYIIITCSFIFLICTILTFALNLFGQSDDTNRTWLVWSSDQVKAFDLQQQAEENFKKQSANQNVTERSQEVDDWLAQLIIECYEDCDNVFTVDRINELRKTELKLKEEKLYKETCWSGPTHSTDCAEDSVNSILDLLTPQQRTNGISQSELDEILDSLINDDDVYNQYSYLLGKDFNKSSKKVKVIRSMFKFGAPLKVDGKLYKNKYDHEDEQGEVIDELSKDYIDLVDKINENSKNGFNVLIFSDPIFDVYMGQTMGTDFLWTFGSIFFVWGYLTFHLQSFFLSGFSMLNILMSFPITLVLVRIVFQVSYFNSLQIFAIFIVLGIAADDVFVFQDAWKQTAQYPFLANDQNKRMAVTFKRAAKAMLATSSTTSAAFLATGFSPIMPISSFGIFAGILVPINYILVITFYPAILIIYENKIAKIKCCPCLRKKEKTANNTTQNYAGGFNNQQENHTVKIEMPEYNSENNSNNGNQKQSTENGSNNNSSTQQVKSKQLSRVEIFLGGKFNEYIQKGRFIILFLFLVWTSIATWRATKLGPQTEPDQWLPDSYVAQRSIQYVQSGFTQSGQSDQAIEVTILFGLDYINSDGTSAWDPEDAGKPVYDKNFNLAPEQNQQHILDLCTDLKSSPLVLDGIVDCFMEDFKDFVTNSGANPENFPVPPSEFFQKMSEFSQDDLGQSYYLTNKLGIFDNKLNHVAITVASIGGRLDGYKDLEPIEERWNNFVKYSNKSAPKGVNKMRQSSFTWAWMVSQKAFVQQGFSGMFISLAFALAVLLFSTHNIIVSLYSIVAITGIVVSVVCIMDLNGWQMGIAESITIVILIGFCVDYVVHLANHYVESSFSDKFTRMQESLQEIGISIISGAITTLGSGIFLFFATVIMFNKFALIIVCTIIFSVLYSLVFFAALMHAFGPEGECGNLLRLFKNNKCKIGSENNNNNNSTTKA